MQRNNKDNYRVSYNLHKQSTFDSFTPETILLKSQIFDQYPFSYFWFVQTNFHTFKGLKTKWQKFEGLKTKKN